MNQRIMPVENAVYETQEHGLIKVLAVGKEDEEMMFAALSGSNIIHRRCSEWSILYPDARLIEALPPSDFEEKGSGLYMGKVRRTVFRRNDGTLELIEG